MPIPNRESFVERDVKSDALASHQTLTRTSTSFLGHAFFCYLCHGNHYYSTCSLFHNDIVCFYNDVDDGIYFMKHPNWEVVTMRDVHMFLRRELGLLEHQVSLSVGNNLVPPYAAIGSAGGVSHCSS